MKGSLRNFFRRSKLDAEMTDEMRAHLDAQTRRNVAAGMSEEDARAAAHRRFGGVAQMQERGRDEQRWLWLEQLIRDLTFAFRAMLKARGFTSVAVVTLALGIGVSTALFSVIHGVLLDPYPYAKSDEIWAPEVTELKTGRPGNFRLSDHLELLKLPAVATGMATAWGGSVTLSGDVYAELINAPRLTVSAFDFLGVPPVIGRGFTAADLKPNGEAEPVCVLSFKLWQRLFNGDPLALGRTLVLDRQPHTVIGVMPPRFGWYGNDGLWLPLTTLDLQRSVRPIFRFKPGVAKEVADQQFVALAQVIAPQMPQRFSPDGFRAAFRNYLDVTVASGEMRSSLHLLLGAVGFLLLIACTNVANLQLARGATRSREIAVRLAVGASRGRLMRQLLTESVVLSLAGGALGVLLAFGLTKGMVLLMPEFYVPNEARVTINGWVLAFTLGLSVLTGVLAGLAPGLQCTKPDLNEALKDGGHAGGVGGLRSARTRNTLVVVEVALAVVLLWGANLTVRGFINLQQIDRGFRAERLLVLRVPLAPQRYGTFESRNAFAREFVERIQHLPGVASVAIGAPPQVDAGSGATIPGQPKIEGGIRLSYVSADFVSTIGLRLLAGQDLTSDEIARGDRVALISEAASKLWPAGESPLGRTIAIDALVGGGGNNLPAPNAVKEVTVVGIVSDARVSLRQAPPPAVMMPYTLRGLTARTYLVRTHGEPNALLNAVRTELRAMDPEQPLLPPMTAEEVLGREFAQPRFNMVLLASLAGIALALAAAGIYSVLSYTVAQRTREFGVRMALGAGRGDIWRLVFFGGGRLILIGLIVGLGASIGLAQIVQSRVFAVPLLDPVALAAAAFLLGVAAVLATWIPARRATRVDPLVALRAE